MNGFNAILRRDLTLAIRNQGEVMMVIAFFAIAATLFAFGVGPEANVQSRIASGVVWTTALLAALLSLERLFAVDYDDGTLDQLLLSGVEPVVLVLAKTLAHWLTTGVALLIAAPAVALGLQLPATGYGALMISLLLGTPILSLLGAVGAAIVLGARRGGVLLSLLLLPLYIPVLIFGAAAVEGAVLGMTTTAPYAVLGGLLILALTLCPWAAATALKHAVE
ncbi:MAG: heme exporter protein CcmB [Rhodospirillaceae bacterium]|nr:heme exporter protein CcmB [Rhodospirillaceae bacterium]